MPDFRDLRNNDQPMPAVYRLLKRLYVRQMSDIMSKYDLTRMELDVLIFLDLNKPADTAAEIVATRCLTKSHVSAAVEHLTQLGLLTQQRDQRNRRKIHLCPTPAAAPILEAGRQMSANITNLLLANVGEDDLAAFMRCLYTIASNAENALNDLGEA